MTITRNELSDVRALATRERGANLGARPLVDAVTTEIVTRDETLLCWLTTSAFADAHWPFLGA